MSRKKNITGPRIIRPRPSIYSVSPELQKKYYTKEHIIKECLAIRATAGGRLPPGERIKASQQLRVSLRMLDIMLNEYQAYGEAFPDHPSTNALIPLSPGRPPSVRFTKEQQTVAIFAYLNSSWISVIEDGPVRDVKLTPTIELVHRLLVYLWPELPVTKDYLRKFLEKRKKQNDAIFTLARLGEEAFWKKYILKKTNDVERPNIRWQSDARPLPVYIRDGTIICTVTLLCIIDDHSRYALKWILLPRKVLDVDGAVRRADFTELDARALLAGALYATRVRPWLLYVDNGNQYTAWKDTLQYLTAPGEPPICMINSKAGRPEGRGKIEVFQALANRALVGAPGFIEKETKQYWRTKWLDLQEKPEQLDTLNHLRQVVDKYFNEEWHAGLLRGHNKRTRAEVWNEGLSTSLPTPDMERFVAFGAATKWKAASVSSDGIYYNETYYQPIEEGGYNRVKNAVSQGIKAPFYVLRLGNEDIARASFDGGHTWETVVPRQKRSITMQKHGDHQVAEFNDSKQELEEGLEELYTILSERYGWDRPGFLRGTRTIIPGEELAEHKADRKRAAPPRSKKKRGGAKPPTASGRRGSGQGSDPALAESGSDAATPLPQKPPTTSPTLSTEQAQAMLDQYQQLWGNQGKTSSEGEVSS